MSTFFDLPNDIIELIYKKKHQMEWREVLKTAGDERHLSHFTNDLFPGETYSIFRDFGVPDCYTIVNDTGIVYLRTTKTHYIFINPNGTKSKFSRTAKYSISFVGKTTRKIQKEIRSERQRQEVANGSSE